MSAAIPELPSWNDTPTTAAIVDFVNAVSEEGNDKFVPPAMRIAVFDNDGTLWSEKPYYHQFFFALHRARELSEADQEWASSPTLKAAAEGDVKGILSGGMPGILELVAATHSGMSVDDFTAEARKWLGSAVHPDTGKRFRDMTFVPMRELLEFMRGKGFKVYIVSGGGVDFMRAFAEEAYGVPPENVIGSMGEVSYQVLDGVPSVEKTGGLAFLDDNEGKPVGIMRHIGRRPIFVGGNSDGDYQMAEWTTAGDGPRMAMIVHHTDAEREFAYDRDSIVGKLDKGLAKVGSPGWAFVDMKQDWNQIWPE